jgi:hypothetical protein
MKLRSASAFLPRLKLAGQFSLIGGIFLLYILYFLLFGYRSAIPFDAGVYWYSSLDFYRDNHFSLLTFDNALRGYVYPLLLFVPRVVTDISGLKPIYMSILLGATTAALAFGYIFPALYHRINPAAIITMKRRIVFALLGFLFWRGYFNYTLSDFPAIICLAVSMLCIVRKKSGGQYLLAGAFLAAAVNIRSVYLIAVPLLLLALVVRAHYSYAFLARSLLAFGVGMVIIFTPQSLINRHNHQTSSFLVQNKVTDLGVNDLYLAQLEWGIRYQKYETSLGGIYPDAKVLFIDPVGQYILRGYGLADNRIQRQQFKSYTEYTAIVLANPVRSLTMYGRHLFNMMDVHHSTPYIRNIYDYNLLLTILNYSLWFAVLLLLIYNKPLTADLFKLLLLGALLVPCLVALPMAVECRFALPAHLLLYALVSFSWPAHWQWKSLGLAQKLKLLGVYGAFLGCCLGMSAQTYSNLEFGKVSLWP